MICLMDQSNQRDATDSSWSRDTSVFCGPLTTTQITPYTDVPVFAVYSCGPMNH